MTEHTPTKTPWRYEKGLSGTDCIWDMEGNQIGACKSLNDMPNEANAALIVRAVNCHDDLVNVLKIIEDSCGKYLEQGHFDYHLSIIRQTLAKAGQ